MAAAMRLRSKSEAKAAE
uniref:Protein disulfide isomerase 1 n=1 Tax=Tetraselmis sp. GSL018 TaxID=582737 RepID=A0A061RX80_9CHLO